jgi:hypothetical protein
MTLVYQKTPVTRYQAGARGFLFSMTQTLRPASHGKGAGLGKRDWEVTQTHHFSIIAQDACEVG